MWFCVLCAVALCYICYLVLVSLFIVVFFFFKQKTAYEMLRSLVGSEMCIRDRLKHQHEQRPGGADRHPQQQRVVALEELRVAAGGREQRQQDHRLSLIHI